MAEGFVHRPSKFADAIFMDVPLIALYQIGTSGVLVPLRVEVDQSIQVGKLLFRLNSVDLLAQGFAWLPRAKSSNVLVIVPSVSGTHGVRVLSLAEAGLKRVLAA
jgi:hypothetical protein